MREKDPVATLFRTPFALMRRLGTEMDRMFEDFEFRRPFAPITRTYDWLPAIEVFQKPDMFIVKAELPGLTKEDVKIEIIEGCLTLEGERKLEKKEEKRDGYVHTERSYGTFFRMIALPEGAKAELAKATFTNGILSIELPVAVSKPITGRRLIIEEPVEKNQKVLVGV